MARASGRSPPAESCTAYMRQNSEGRPSEKKYMACPSTTAVRNSATSVSSASVGIRRMRVLPIPLRSNPGRLAALLTRSIKFYRKPARVENDRDATKELRTPPALPNARCSRIRVRGSIAPYRSVARSCFDHRPLPTIAA